MNRMCLLCAEQSGEASFDAKGLSSSDPRFTLVRCSRCGLGWTDPAPSQSEIGRWYPPAYYGKENVRFNVFFELLVRIFRRRRARLIAGRSRPGPILDAGCGRGILLNYLRRWGYAPHGTELTEEGAWHARHRMGIEMRVGPFAGIDYPKGRFEAIIFWHSLEHMARPEEALRRAAELLVPEGLLVVAVPNSESLQARWFGADWFHLDIPRHYYHFGSRSLESLLARAGFRVSKTDHFSLEQNPYGFLQSLYNRLGLEFNLLYSILKNHTSRTHSLRDHPAQCLAILALLPLFLPLSLAAWALEILLRRGGTIEVYATKTSRE